MSSSDIRARTKHVAKSLSIKDIEWALSLKGNANKKRKMRRKFGKILTYKELEIELFERILLMESK